VVGAELLAEWGGSVRVADPLPGQGVTATTGRKNG
jgi:hypothetical protein